MADDDEDCVHDEATGEWRPALKLAGSEATGEDVVHDAAGAPPMDGASVTLIKDLTGS